MFPASGTTLGSDVADSSEVVLQCANARQYPKLVSKPLAELVDRFREPRRLTEAIVLFARDSNLNPEEVFDAALESLLDLVEAEFLLPEKRQSEPAIHPRFVADQHFAGLQILKQLRQATDTEVYLACDGAGALRCLKTLSADADASAESAFGQEIRITQLLSGQVSPSLLDVIDHDGTPVMISDWIDGDTADRAVAHLHSHTPSDVPVLLDRIVRAFAAIHERGILHGDIRASNILVDHSQKVWIVDFGLAGFAREKPAKRSFELSVMEPEAVPDLMLDRLPALTAKGEQYNLAILLAELATGAEARALPALRAEALAHIKAAPPIQSSKYPALNRATARDPAQRFATLSDFADALSGTGHPAASPDVISVFCPSSTTSAGALDRAYVQFQKACATGDAEILAAADRSFRIAQDSGFIPLEKASPLHTELGGACLGLEISLVRTDFETARHQIKKIEGALSNPPDQAELFTGRAGYLSLAAHCVTRMRIYDDAIAALDDPIAALQHTVSNDLTEAIRSLEAGGPVHLGMAHGLAGLVYALLKTNAFETPLIREALDVLSAQSVSTPWGLAWPGTVNPLPDKPRTTDFAPGWCSGSAGFLALFQAADRVIPGRYQAQFSGARDYALRHPDNTANLCCGAAGRVMLLRSAGIAERDLSKLQRNSLSLTNANESLFRGKAGAELSCLPHAQFPV